MHAFRFSHTSRTCNCPEFTENQGESLAVHGGDESDSADTFGMLNECFKCLHIV